MKFQRTFFFAIGLALNFYSVRVIGAAETNSALSLTDGWKQVPFKYQIQHPYDLKTADRYDFDATNNIHHFWVFFTDKPHARRRTKRPRALKCVWKLSARANTCSMAM